METPDQTLVPTGDPLIDEVRAIRQKISEQFSDDVNRLAERLRAVESQYPGRVLQPADLKPNDKGFKAS